MKTLIQPFAKLNPTYLYMLFGLQFITIISIWQFSTPDMIPQPTDVFSKLLNFLSSRDFYEDLTQSIILTGKAMLYSIIIACIIGYASVIPFFSGIAHFLVKLRYLTLVGLVFTFTLILQKGSDVKLSLLMFGIIPFFVLSLLSVINKIEQKEFDLCKTIGMNKWETLWELVILGRMDQTIETIRANFAIAWLMITIVETFSMSEGGIGVMLYRFNKYNQLDNIFALQFIIFGLGMLFDYLLTLTRTILFPHVKFSENKR
jgi:NitT/TauT family transport system permease protein